VVDRPLGETPARREPRVTGSDDDGGDLFDDSSPDRYVAVVLLTATVTLVGLVTTSYTAERFCDCATIASMSSSDASASMSKLTLISSYPLRTSLSIPRMP